jgi:hypothetical protein
VLFPGKRSARKPLFLLFFFLPSGKKVSDLPAAAPTSPFVFLQVAKKWFFFSLPLFFGRPVAEKQVITTVIKVLLKVRL